MKEECTKIPNNFVFIHVNEIFQLERAIKMVVISTDARLIQYFLYKAGGLCGKIRVSYLYISTLNGGIQRYKRCSHSQFKRVSDSIRTVISKKMKDEWSLFRKRFLCYVLIVRYACSKFEVGQNNTIPEKHYQNWTATRKSRSVP